MPLFTAPGSSQPWQLNLPPAQAATTDLHVSASLAKHDAEPHGEGVLIPDSPAGPSQPGGAVLPLDMGMSQPNIAVIRYLRGTLASPMPSGIP